MCYIRPRFYAHISIHAPARGATVYERVIFKDSEFQSTLPRGERLSLCSSADIHVSFQSTLPRGERRAGMNTAPGCRIFQSTLPRGERRASAARTPKRKTISIHAPARGATKDLLRKVNLPEISIHAPARGATHAIRTRCFRFGYFNPRSREGSDSVNASFCFYTMISIHAPARGATSILSKIHPMFLTISHNASSFSSFPFHSFLPHLLNSSTFCALFQVRISRAFSVYYRFAPKKSTPDL